MGWLLHSKMFKEKLTKWIIMYVAVMCLLGSVITYSKFISDLKQDPEGASTASFNVAITPKATCGEKPIKITNSNQEEIEVIVKDCSLTTRPTKDLEYIYNVDYNGLDVNTEVIVRIAFAPEISNYKEVILYEVIEDKEGKEIDNKLFNFTEHENNEGKPTTVGDYKITRGSNSILLTDIIDIAKYTKTDSDGKMIKETIPTKKFKLVMEIDPDQVQKANQSSGDKKEYEYFYDTELNYTNLIVVGYTATQFRDSNDLR